MNINLTQKCVEIHVPTAKDYIKIPLNILSDKHQVIQYIATHLMDFCRFDRKLIELTAKDAITAAVICWVGAEKVYENLEKDPDLTIFLVMNS